MAYSIIHSEISYQYPTATKRSSALALFFKWAANQDEENHIAWVGGSITAMAAVFFPATMSAVLLNGAHFGLIIAAMISLALVVITNLAAMSTKYTIPFFILGILFDVAIVIASFVMM